MFAASYCITQEIQMILKFRQMFTDFNINHHLRLRRHITPEAIVLGNKTDTLPNVNTALLPGCIDKNYCHL